MTRIIRPQLSKASQLDRAGLSVTQNSLARWKQFYYHIITIGTAIRLKITGQSFKKERYSEISKTAWSPFSFLVYCFSSIISRLSFTLFLSLASVYCTLQFALAMFLSLLSCFALASCLLILCTHQPSISCFLASLWLLSIQLKIKCALAWHWGSSMAKCKNNSFNTVLITMSPSVSYRQIALIF